MINTKQLALGIALLATSAIACSQEFVVSQTQTNNQTNCQDNCPSESQGGQNATQIDRSGMDKASVHLQILQQASQKFAEPSNTKKNTSDDKKTPSKPQEHS
jgi:hypothetical protein